MARRSVDVRASGMMVVRKHAHKDLGGGHLGLVQVRTTKNVVKDPRLQKILSCMAGELSGKKPGTLGGIQKAFKEARSKCKF
jgi:hypothetical protein